MKNNQYHGSIIAVAILTLINAQLFAQCVILNSTPSLSFAANPTGTKTISVQTESGCTDYTVSQIGTFFTYYRSGTNLVVECQQNTTFFSRTGRILLNEAGQNFQVVINQVAACSPQNPPGEIQGDPAACHNATKNFLSSFVTGLNEYVWSVSSGQIVSGQGSGSVNILFSGSTGTVTVSVFAKNSCGSVSSARTFQVNVVSKPSAPTAINHNPNLCTGSNYTFSVAAQSGYTYEWVVEGTGYQIESSPPHGSSIQVKIGTGTGTINVKYINNTGCKSDEFSKPVSSVGGAALFYVSGNGNICPGTSTTIHLDDSESSQGYTLYFNGSPVTTVTGNGESLTFGPYTPGEEGSYTVFATNPGGYCEVQMPGLVVVDFKPATPNQPGTVSKSTSALCVNTNASFWIDAVPGTGTNGYTWSTSGTSSISGQGTTNVTITFLSSGTQTVYVTAGNECGTSIASSTSVNVVSRPPAPASISNNPVLCGGNNYTFAVTPQAGFTYEWTLEGTGYQIVSDPPYGSSVQVRVGPGTGTIKVKYVNSTGCKSDDFVKPLSPEQAATPFYVTGNGNICPGTSTTIILDGSESNQAYTLYFDGQAVEQKSGTGAALPFTALIPSEEKTYTVKAVNTGGNCEVLMLGSVDVDFKPAKPDQPGMIQGPLMPVCNGSTAEFNIAAVDRATTYTWSGAAIQSGQGVTVAQIHFSGGGTSVPIQVTAANECGSSDPSIRYFMVTQVATPVFLPSAPNQCGGGEYTYRVEPTSGYSYTWEIPDTWSIIGGQGSSSVRLKAGRYDGNIKVTAHKNGCNSQPAIFFADITEPPGVFALTASQSFCEGNSFTLQLSGSAIGYDYVLRIGETSVATKPGSNGVLNFGPLTDPGVYKVYSSLESDCYYPMDGEAVVVKETASIAPVSVTASALETCANENVILTVYGGVLGSGAKWSWYTGSCTGIAIGTGSQISVKPSASTVYYVRAEGVCNVTACASVQINVVPGCADRSDYNYVRVRTPQKAGYMTLPVNSVVEDVATEYQYFDPLGRRSQTISVQGSPSQKDIFSIYVRDEFGRERLQYLPASVTTNWGLPATGEVTKIEDFYDAGNASHPPNVAATTKPLAETMFESSPLGRVLKQGAPGEAHQPIGSATDFNDHTIKKKYDMNVSNEVLLFNYDQSTEQVALSNMQSERHYPPNELYANKTYDEHNNEVIEYVDKEGRTVCKKVQYGTSGTEPDIVKLYACTYYLYDDFGNLVLVIPPEGLKKLLELYNLN